MKKPGGSDGSASQLISKRIAGLDDWRGKTLIRRAIALNRSKA